MAKLKFRVCTWLPFDKVTLADIPGLKSVYYKGDTRTKPDFYSSAYRTIHEFTVDTSTQKATQGYKYVSGTTSYHYDSSGKLVNTKTNPGGTSGLTYTSSKSGSNLVVKLTCDAPNKQVPLAPAINYEMTFTFDSQGNLTLGAMHDGFPAYEVWRQKDSNKPINIYNHNPLSTGETPASLFPPMEHSVRRSLPITV